MKKFLLIPMATLLFACFFTSCSSVSYKVTVLAKDSTFLVKAITGTPMVFVVTESDDTLLARISDEILLNNKMPFKALMDKTNGSKVGRITRTIR